MATFVTTNAVEEALRDRKPVIRFTELIESSDFDELTLRRQSEQLEIKGKIRRFVVGEHVFLRYQPTSAE
jgi:hypothetical protein